MDREMFLGLLAIEGISFSATYYVQARGGGGSICLHCCSITFSESGSDIG